MIYTEGHVSLDAAFTDPRSVIMLAFDTAILRQSALTGVDKKGKERKGKQGTQENLGILLGLSNSQISDYRLGKKDIPIHVVLKLKDLLRKDELLCFIAAVLTNNKETSLNLCDIFPNRGTASKKVYENRNGVQNVVSDWAFFILFLSLVIADSDYNPLDEFKIHLKASYGLKENLIKESKLFRAKRVED